ncbi:MAG: hypothetical protein R3C19_17525 [Planctomycetaceae bacterium]
MAFERGIPRAGMTAVAWMLAFAALATSTAFAQPGYHQPLNQHVPPGKAAGWMNLIRRYDPSWLQPVRVELPSTGDVAVFSASSQPSAMAAAPATFAVNAGHVYRLQVSNMPEFPGVELFPTIELLDHLHPPVGREDEFPIPVPLAADDIRIALSGQMVTRVIYLEQPQTAQALDPLRREFPQSVGPTDNALEEADRLGRPMMIVRIGSRRPIDGSTPASFFGTGGAVEPRATVLPPEFVDARPATPSTAAIRSLVQR